MIVALCLALSACGPVVGRDPALVDVGGDESLWTAAVVLVSLQELVRGFLAASLSDGDDPAMPFSLVLLSAILQFAAAMAICYTIIGSGLVSAVLWFDSAGWVGRTVLGGIALLSGVAASPMAIFGLGGWYVYYQPAMLSLVVLPGAVGFLGVWLATLAGGMRR